MTDRFIGIDIGGTKIAGGVVDTLGAVHAWQSVPTPHGNSDEILTSSVTVATTLMAEHDITAVGVGTGGVVDPEQGTIISSTDLLTDWAGTDVSGHLHSQLGVPIHVDNDVNVLAVGEIEFCSVWGTVLYVAVGTGIGGAVIVDGALRHGNHFTAGGIGHMMSPKRTRRSCSCGRQNHLEALASGPGVAATYRERSGSPESETLETIAQKADAGDGIASDVIHECAYALGQTVAGAANLLDPDIIVVGGGVAEIGDPFWIPLRSGIYEEVLPPLKDVPVAPPKLDINAAVVGAAALCLHRQQPSSQNESTNNHDRVSK